MFSVIKSEGLLKEMQQKSCLNSEHGLHLTSDPWIFLWHYPNLMVASLDKMHMAFPD